METEKNKKKKVNMTVVKNLLSHITEFSSGIQNNSHSYPGISHDLLEWFLEDLDLRARLEKKHDKLVDIGFNVIRKDYKPADRKALERLEQLGWNEWLTDSLWQELLFYNSFTELGKNASGEVKQMRLIKTDEIEIVNLPNGKVVKYLQIPSSTSNGEPKIIGLAPSRVVHIRFGRVSTSLWGVSPIITAIPILYTRRLIEHFIEWLFFTNQFRAVLKIPDLLDEDEVEKYIQLIKQNMARVNNFLLIQGDGAEIKPIRDFKNISELRLLIDMYNDKLNNILQLPPLESGNIENSNRSSSEYQVRYSYYSHLRSFLKQKAIQINTKLFPAIGLKDYMVVPRLVDDVSRKDLIGSAQMLMALGVDSKEINKYLIKNGLDISPNSIKPIQTAIKQEGVNGNKKVIPGKLEPNSDLYPSRNKTEMDFAGGNRNKAGN